MVFTLVAIRGVGVCLLSRVRWQCESMIRHRSVMNVGLKWGKSGFSRKQNRVSVDRGFCGRENEQQFISKKKLKRNTFQNIEKRTKT